MMLPTKEELTVALKTVGYFDIYTEFIHVWISPRPDYCDRGSYLVNAESTDYSKLTIDGADFFPRYYFGFDAMMSELEAWLRKRGQWK